MTHRQCHHMTDIDVSLPISLLGADQRNELELLLQPVSEDYPSGPPIRFDPIFTEIRLAREEDDPTLPMGVWERPLKRADWALIEARCKFTLSSHAKDLQIAAWLAESWCRQHGMEGLLRGLLLVHGLLARYWETVHPQVDEDGDAERRAAPLEWMNLSLASTIRTRMPLLGRATGWLGQLHLVDWERMARDGREPAKPGRPPAREDGEPLPTRADVVDHARADPDGDVDRGLALARGGIAVVEAIERLTLARLGSDAPSMSKLRDTLRAVERVWLDIAPERELARPQDAVPMSEPASGGSVRSSDEVSDDASGEAIRPHEPAQHNVAPPEVADELGRRIDAICAAAGIHQPSGSERLMAMQIGLLFDQNLIMQGLSRNQAGQMSSASARGVAGGGFTTIVRAVLAGEDGQ